LNFKELLLVIVNVNSTFLQCYSKAKRKASAYSESLPAYKWQNA